VITLGDKTVEAFYDHSAEYEWERLARHRVEYVTTWRAMQEFIPPASAILDIGGGPGRYSIALARAGHRVTLLDLAEANVIYAREKAAELNAPILDFIHGDALDLRQFTDAVFDVVLLMGPLYHLLAEEDRRRAVSEALRILKPGGLIFASFITRYAFLVDLLKNEPRGIKACGSIVEGLLGDGLNIISEANPGFTNAYFIHPLEIEPLMASYGLTKLRLAAAEALIAQAEPSVAILPENLFQVWLDLSYRLGTDPITWGATEHMLYVGKKPHAL